MEKKTIQRVGVIALLLLCLFFLLVSDLSELKRKPDSNRNLDAQTVPYEKPTISGESQAIRDARASLSGRDDRGTVGRSGIDRKKTPEEESGAEGKPYVDHEILVRFSPSVSREEMVSLLNGFGMSIEQILNHRNLCRVKLPESMKVEAAVRILKGIPEVDFSEPNYIVHTTNTPDDPFFPNQWGFHNTGTSGGVADADIDAVEAWDSTTGSSSVVVAVVDEGIDLNHPDLAGNIWVNPSEIPDNGIDDDGNGYVDDVNGWDFKHGDATVYDGSSEDQHGTEVAGIIGAVGNNGTGVSGICWNVRIMPVKFISFGSGTVSDAILALDYAVQNGARVINCSWGGTSYSEALKSAFQDALDAGVLVVTSAGNSGVNTDTSSHYPSNYDLANILSVAATDKNDTLSSFSNYGLTTVDLGAPGSSIYTTTPEKGYAYFSGTSAAAPFVTGAAALALSVDSGLSMQDLKDDILNSVDAVDSLTGKTVTGGRLNINNLIRQIGSPDSDGDGMPNRFEIQYGLDPNDATDADADPDGDGLTNFQEYQNATSPVSKDTDGDGLSDGFEVTYLLDPTSASDAALDSDQDGLTNLQEYQAGTRIDQQDTDGDGIDDFTEYGPRNQAADSDGDGVIDALDSDSDNDGTPDQVEGIGDQDEDGIANYVDMNDTDGPQGDQDGDGITNSVEVTFNLYPNLPDTDGDGIGDGAEFGTGAKPLDSDGDGVIDAMDLDSDNDGTMDQEEGTGDLDGDGTPNYRDHDDQDGPLGDADGDGLLNQIESLYGMNVNLADSDGDGISDAMEFGNGVTPADSDGDGIIDALDLDSDNDGALDANENGLDSDGDGIPDRLDPDTATVRTGYGSLSLQLQGGSATLKDVVFLAQPVSEGAMPNLDFRYGGVQYKVSGLQPGGSITLLIQMDVSIPTNAEFWKYNSRMGYYQFPAQINGNTLSYTLTDGGAGDDDGVVDGTILDPGYIGVPLSSNSTSGSSGGGGGGGGGCALSQTPADFSQGFPDFLLFSLPLILLCGIRFAGSIGHKRFRT